VVRGGREGGGHAGGRDHIGYLAPVFPVDLSPKNGGDFISAAGAGGEVGGGVEVLPWGVFEEADFLVVGEALGDAHGVALEDVAGVEAEGGAFFQAVVQHAWRGRGGGRRCGGYVEANDRDREGQQLGH